jgi:hypothetical protein
MLSGATLLVLAATPVFTRKERLQAVLFGAGILGYGVYIGTTDGSFMFPLWFFVFPFLFVAVGLAGVYERWTKSRASTADEAAATSSAVTPVGGAPVPQELRGAFAPGAGNYSAEQSRPFLYGSAERP